MLSEPSARPSLIAVAPRCGGFGGLGGASRAISMWSLLLEPPAGHSTESAESQVLASWLRWGDRCYAICFS